nr:uncharacterized protein LOC107373186 isoform X2 [Nothobranchius furzeri]
MEADEELETMMLSLSPSKLLPRDGSEEKTEQKTRAACPPATARHLASAAASQPDQSDDCSTPLSSASGPASMEPPLPVPPELLALKIPSRKTTPPLRLEPVSGLALLPGTPAASSASSASPAASGQSVLGHPTTPAPPSAVSAARDPPAQSQRPAVPPMPSYKQDMSRWNCSHQQRIWMKTEMESLGLWPGSRPGEFLNRDSPTDHTCKVAWKVVLSSGTVSSYAVMNENWMILSWAMLQSESDKSLEPVYEGLSCRYVSAGQPKATHKWVDRDCCAAFRIPNPGHQEHLLWDSWKTTDDIIAEATSGNLNNSCASRQSYNSKINIKLDLFHCMRRFTRECTSEHHPLRSAFCKFLSAAFCVVDQTDLRRLRQAYVFCGIIYIRQHCRTKIPQPRELLVRVESVLQKFFSESDPDGVPVFKPSMLKVWRIQRVHILRGCLSGPEVGEGVLYRHGGMVQLNHVKGEEAAVPVWIPVRGTSQQEGFQFHQSKWVTGTRVSTELFQVQGMIGVALWNFQHLLDLKQPDVQLPLVFDPASVSELNKLSEEVTGQAKHPALRLSNADTGERFGLQYLEPGCQPVPLDWNKPRAQNTPASPTSEPTPPFVTATDLLEEVKVELFAQDDAAGVTALGTQTTVQPGPNKVLPPPLPLAACPRAARTGPIKTGGLLFVLDHSRWTQPMRETIDQIVAKHRGQKDFLTKVDAEYAVLVQAASRDPNSLLHPTAKQHRSRYIKHLATMTNTSSSLNTSSETLLETQRLWHNLTEGSETVAVPVVTIPPATVNPPRIKAQDPPLTKTEIEKMVKDIVQKHQEQQQQQPAKKRTRNCVACGQPKSRFRGDGSSVHFFYQSGEVKYFYCSVKVHQTYAPEGLTDPRMPFVDFADSPFFMRELEAAKLRSTETKQVMEERKKRKATEEHPTGRLCRFCHKPIKQGRDSPHVHTGFPGVTGKYIYCPSKVFSLYKAEGMTEEMTWRQFCQSSFYETEKKRWAAEQQK